MALAKKIKNVLSVGKHFPVFIYVLSFSCSMFLLYSARQYQLLGMPMKGMDQLSMYQAAINMYRGIMPDAGYMYSPAYTIFLYIIATLSQGSIIIMRIIQAAVCSLVPVFIYHLCRRLRLGRQCAQISSLLYCFYGPAMLISLSFLRAVPLALCFLMMLYFLVAGFTSRKISRYIAAGAFAGLAILGRENFIPVIFVPLIMLLLPNIRKHVRFKFAAGYFIAMLIFILPVILYNGTRHGSLAIVPGHTLNVLQAYHGKEATEDSSVALKSIVDNIPKQVKNYFSSYEIPNSLSFYAHRELIPFLRVFAIPFNLLLALAITSLLLFRKNKGVVLIAMTIAAYVATMLLFDIYYRFRIPTVPLLTVLGGAVAAKILTSLEKKKFITALIPLAVVTGLFLLSYTNPNKLRPVRERRNVAAALIHYKRFDEAERYIDQLRAENKSEARLEVYMIKYLYTVTKEKSEATRLMQKWPRTFLKRK